MLGAGAVLRPGSSEGAPMRAADAASRDGRGGADRDGLGGTAGTPRGEAARASWGRGRPARRGPARTRVRARARAGATDGWGGHGGGRGGAAALAAPWLGSSREREKRERKQGPVHKIGLRANNHGVKLGAKIYSVKVPAKSPPRLRRVQDLAPKSMTSRRVSSAPPTMVLS